MPSWTEGYCHNCTHWEWESNIRLSNGKVTYPGHCGLYSSACVTAIGNHANPVPYYLPMEDKYEEMPDNQVPQTA